MPEIVLTVPSLTCRLCAREVSAALRDVPGVRTVAVDLHATTVQVRGAVTLERLQAAVVASGHALLHGSEEGHDHVDVGHDRVPRPDRAGSLEPGGEHP